MVFAYSTRTQDSKVFIAAGTGVSAKQDRTRPDAVYGLRLQKIMTIKTPSLCNERTMASLPTMKSPRLSCEVKDVPLVIADAAQIHPDVW